MLIDDKNLKSLFVTHHEMKDYAVSECQTKLALFDTIILDCCQYVKLFICDSMPWPSNEVKEKFIIYKIFSCSLASVVLEWYYKTYIYPTFGKRRMTEQGSDPRSETPHVYHGQSCVTVDEVSLITTAPYVHLAFPIF